MILRSFSTMKFRISCLMRESQFFFFFEIKVMIEECLAILSECERCNFFFDHELMDVSFNSK